MCEIIIDVFLQLILGSFLLMHVWPVNANDWELFLFVVVFVTLIKSTSVFLNSYKNFCVVPQCCYK